MNCVWVARKYDQSIPFLYCRISICIDTGFNTKHQTFTHTVDSKNKNTRKHLSRKNNIPNLII